MMSCPMDALALAVAQSSFLNPMSFAYSLKHCLHRFSLYLRIIPWRLEHARLQPKQSRD